MIQVRNIGDNTFQVTVEGPTSTKHKVTVDPAYGRKLTGGRVSPEVLIEKSFAFLLEREPNTSILRVFDLSVIGKYFPEYELEIRKDIG